MPPPLAPTLDIGLAGGVQRRAAVTMIDSAIRFENAIPTMVSARMR